MRNNNPSLCAHRLMRAAEVHRKRKKKKERKREKLESMEE